MAVKEYVRLEKRGGMHGFIPFGDRWVNLNRLSCQESLDYSYLWRVFNGARTPKIDYLQRVSKCIRMSMTEFLDAIEGRRAQLANPPEDD